MSNLPIIDVLADLVSLVVSGRTLPSSPRPNSIPPSGPSSGPAAVQLTSDLAGFKPVAVTAQLPRLTRASIGPPGWLGSLVQFGQMTHSCQISYLVDHTDAFGDGASANPATSRYSYPIVDDRTSERVLLVGHREPPHPDMPMEWICNAPNNRPVVSVKNGVSNLWRGRPLTSSYSEALEFWQANWNRQGHAEQHRGWLVTDSPAPKVSHDLAASKAFRRAQWLVWATECLRTRVRPGIPPAWWLLYVSSWGLRCSKCTQPRFFDVKVLSNEPWEDIAKRIMATVGRPGEHQANDKHWIAQFHVNVGTISPTIYFDPPQGDWKTLIWQRATVEAEKSALGQYQKYFMIVFKAVGSYIGSIGGIGGMAASAVLTNVDTIAAAVQSGQWRGVVAIFVDVIEHFAAEYAKIDEIRAELGPIFKAANGIDLGQFTDAQSASTWLQNMLGQADQEWGYVSDLVGGGMGVLSD